MQITSIAHHDGNSASRVPGFFYPYLGLGADPQTWTSSDSAPAFWQILRHSVGSSELAARTFGFTARYR
jgi:hypothetical protein